MNKYKKIAAIAVTAVMAGSMVGMVAACGGSTEEVDNRPTVFTGYTAGTELRLNLGYTNSNNPASAAYVDSDLSGRVTLPDGVSYSVGNLKPAWAALQSQLNVKITDAFTNESSDAAITNAVTNQKLGDYEVITGSLAKINEYGTNFLDLSYYLNLMPNYKAFLEANPVVMYSLTASPDGSAMYAAPYFDGLNDIEKYELFNQIWVSNILDATDETLNEATTLTFAAQATAKKLTGTSASATAYMGTTDWSVDTTNRTTPTTTVKLNVKYSAARTAANDANSNLGKALRAAWSAIPEQTSGNIVDLMNAVINGTSGGVTGAQLTKILQEYIDVTYVTDANAKFYATRSDVFNGVDAGWDVDLLTALSRCVCTATSLLGETAKESMLIYGLNARQQSTQRRVDLITLAGTLYGFRGADSSRYEYAYIDNNGNLQDARNNAETYTLLANMSNLAKEGLLYTGNANNTTYDDGAQVLPQAMMIHDYAQTQTTHGLDMKGGVPDTTKYNFAPVVTPVSKWDVDGDGNHTDIMRFTESWRSVKNTGLCVPRAVANDTNKLNATLAFIDYFFSPDGQLLMTYGPTASTLRDGTTTKGWWKATEATGVTLAQVADVAVPAHEASSDTNIVTNYYPAQYKMKAQYQSQYFVYNGKVYTGTAYNGRVVPTMSDDNMSFYLGGTVNEVTQTDGGPKFGSVGSYTNYARRALGTTLPFGNKDQGFEYQCTAQCALDGAAKVAAGVVNGTIKHVKLSLDQGESMWYMTCPTALPYSNADRTIMTSDAQGSFTSTYFYNNSKTELRLNVFIDLIYYGFDVNRPICGIAANGQMKANGQAYVDWIKTAADGAFTQRLSIMQRSWTTLKGIYSL